LPPDYQINILYSGVRWVELEAWFEKWPSVGPLMRRKLTAIDYAAVARSVERTTLHSELHSITIK